MKFSNIRKRLTLKSAKQRQNWSFRKTTIGLCSVLLSTTLLWGITNIQHNSVVVRAENTANSEQSLFTSQQNISGAQGITSYVGISSADGSSFTLNDGSAISITYPTLDATSSRTDYLPLSDITLSPYGTKNFTFYIYSKQDYGRTLSQLNYNITQGTNTVIVASYSSKLGNGINYNNFKVYQAPELTEVAKKGLNLEPGASLPDPSTVLANYNTVKKGAMKIEWGELDTQTTGQKTAKLNITYNGSGAWGMRGEGGATYTRTLDVPVAIYSVKDPVKTPVPKAYQTDLTTEYKEKIIAAIKEANPNAQDVTVDSKGNATVSFPGETKAEVTSDRTIKDVDKSELDAAIKDGTTTKTQVVYINADSSKKTAYDQALTDGKSLYDSDTASQDEIDSQVSQIKVAKEALNGKETNKTGLEEAIKKAEEEKGKESYGNASNAAKSALDLAIQKAKDVLNDENASQEDVDKAISDLNDAISGLSNSQAKDVQAPTKTPVPEAYRDNLNDEYKNRIVEAVKEANENADLVVVDNLGNVVITFKDGSIAKLSKDETVKDVDKTALNSALSEYSDTIRTPEYYNASQDAKDNYDKTKADGQEASASTTASQEMVDTATTAITNAKKALDGKVTDKQQLQDLYAKGNSTKESQVYTNGSTAGQNALKEALATAQQVIDNDQATQEEVNVAVKQLQDALDLLAKSQAFFANNPEKVAIPKAYYQKQLTRNLKSKVENEIRQANPDVVDTVTVNDPGAANVVFKDGSKKYFENTVTTKEVDTSRLKQLTDEQESIHKTGLYINASEGAQSRYDSTIGDGLDGLENPTLTQDQVDTLADAIENAKSMLDGYETNKQALKELLDEAPSYKLTEPYTTASDEARQAYDQAINAGSGVYNEDTFTQKEVDTMVQIIEKAKRDLQESSDEAASKINLSINKTPVGDKESLTEGEKDKVKAEVQKVNTDPDILEITTNNDGSVNVKFKDGSSVPIDSRYTIKETDKTALKNAIDLEDYVKTQQTVNYNGQDIKIYESATAVARKEYDDAIEAGKVVYTNDKATQDEIDAATKRINDAVKGLVSAATNAQVNFNYGFGLTPVINLDNVSDSEKTIIKSKIAEGNKGDDGQTLVDIDATTIDAEGSAVVAMKDGSKVHVDKKFTVRAVNKSVLQKDIEIANDLKGNKTEYDKATDAARANFEEKLTNANAANDNPTSQEDVDKAASELEQAMSDLIKSIKAASSKVKQPTTQIAVGRDRELYTKEEDNEKGKIEAAVREVNPNASSVESDVYGNVTVHLSDGTTVVIDKSKTTKDTTKDALKDAIANAKNEEENGNIYKNASTQSKQDFDTALTKAQEVFDSTKSSQKEIDDATNSLKTAFETMADSVKTAQSKVNKDVERTPVGNKTNITEKESLSIHDKVLAKNPNTTVTVDNEGNATVEFSDGSKGFVSNDYTTTNVDKSQLQASFDQATGIKDTDTVNNASTNAKEKFNEAYNQAKETLAKATATQDDVNNTKSALDEAMQNLSNSLASAIIAPERVAVPKGIQGNITEESGYVAKIQDAIKVANEGKIEQVAVASDGSAIITFTDGSIAKLTSGPTIKDVDKSALVNAVNEAPSVKGTAKYYNADAALQTAYTDQITVGQTMLDRDSDSQEAINEQVSNIQTAKNNLNGIDTNKEQLRILYGTVDSVKAGSTYANASAKAKTDLDSAANRAKAVLDNDSSTQKEVDDAYAALDEAIKALSDSQATKMGAVTPVEVPKSIQSNLTDDFKSEIRDAVKSADENVDIVKVDNEGNVTVIMKDGSTTSLDKSKTVTDVDKSALRPLVEEADTVKASAKYYNADDELKDAYDTAISHGNDILTSDSATKEDVAQAVTDITKAKNALDGAETNKDGLRATYTNATELKDGDSYKLGTAAAKEAFDKAYSDADSILKKDNATQKEVNDANDALQKAMAGFGDSEASKIIMPEKTVVPEYYQDNLEDSTNPYAQKIIDAIKAKNPKATDDITFSGDEAVVKFEDGSQIGVKKINLISNVSFDTLKPLVDEANDVMESVKYKNADRELQTAYITTVNKGSKALGDTKIDQSSVDTLVTEISNAKNALNGQETDKSELEALVKEAPEVKEANKNASTKAKEAYDEAIQAGQDVLDNSDATQSEVNEAKEKIEEAKRNLANEIKTLAEKLNVEVTKTEVGDKKNITESEKSEITKNVTDAVQAKNPNDKFEVSVDNQGNATVTFEDGSVGQITNDKTTKAVDKTGLQSDVNKQAAVHKTSKYYNASEETKQAYDEAIQAGQVVLDNEKATKQAVTDARSEIQKALDALDGEETNFDKLIAAIAKAEEAKTSEKYVYESDANKEAFDEMLDKAKAEMGQTNVSQKTVDQITDELIKAINSLTGVKPAPVEPEVVPTKSEVNKSELQSQLDKGKEVQNSPQYQSATSESKAKLETALDNGQKIYDDKASTQEQVNEASQSIETALANLTSTVEKPVSTPQTPTKSVVITKADSRLNKAKSNTLPKQAKLPQTGETTKANTWLGFGVIGLLLAVLGIKKKKEDE